MLPKYLATFFGYLKSLTFKKKLLQGSFWAAYWKDLGYFLLQHLVTLALPSKLLKYLFLPPPSIR